MSVPASSPALAPSVFLQRSVVMPAYGRLDLAYTTNDQVPSLAAGLGTKFTTPGGQLAIPQQITYEWATSPTVGNRFVGLQFQDPQGNIIGQTFQSGPQPASTAYVYTFMLDSGAAFISGNYGIAPLPFIFLPERYTWRVAVINADANDFQFYLTYTTVRVPTGPPLQTAPPTITASPVLV